MTEGGVEKLHIDRWTNHRILPASVILIFGKRNSGKTVLMKDLCRSLVGKCDCGILFSPTVSTHKMFKSFFPESLMHSTFSEPVLQQLIDTQLAACSSGGGSKKLRSLIILDDCLFDKKTTTNKALKYLVFNGRHLPACVIITCQYLNSLSPSVRSNADVVFCLRENNYASRKKLHESFFGVFSHFSSFASVLNRCTEGYSALVYDSVMSRQGNSLTNGIYHYKASLEPNPKLFSAAMWSLQRKFYDESRNVDGEAKPAKRRRRKPTQIPKDVTVVLK